MGTCKCGAVLPGNRKTCDACKAEQAREAARRRAQRLREEARTAYEAAPKRCRSCGAVLSWEQRKAAYCGSCAYERKKQRAKEYSERLRKAAPGGPAACIWCGAPLPEGRRRGLCEACAAQQKQNSKKASKAKAREKARAAGKKKLTLREVVWMLKQENAARHLRGDEPLSYGRFVQEKGL